MTPTTYPEELVGQLAERLRPFLHEFITPQAREDAARAALDFIFPLAFSQGAEAAAKICDDYGRDGLLTRTYECETADELAARIRALTKNEERG